MSLSGTVVHGWRKKGWSDNPCCRRGYLTHPGYPNQNPLLFYFISFRTTLKWCLVKWKFQVLSLRPTLNTIATPPPKPLHLAEFKSPQSSQRASLQSLSLVKFNIENSSSILETSTSQSNNSSAISLAEDPASTYNPRQLFPVLYGSLVIGRIGGARGGIARV